MDWPIHEVVGVTYGLDEAFIERTRESHAMYSERYSRTDVTLRGTVEERMATVAAMERAGSELVALVERARKYVDQTPAHMCPPSSRHLVDDGTGWAMWVEGRDPDGKPNWKVCPHSRATSVRRGARGSLACTQLPCRKSTCESCGARMRVTTRAAILAVVDHYIAAGWSARLIAGDLGTHSGRWTVDGAREWITVGPWTALLWAPNAAPQRPKRGPTSALVAVCLDPDGRTPDGIDWVDTAAEWSASLTTRATVVAVRDELLRWRREKQNSDAVVTSLAPHRIPKVLFSFVDEHGDTQSVIDVQMVDADQNHLRNTTTVTLSRLPQDQWEARARPPMGDVGDLYSTEMLRAVLPPARRYRSDEAILAEINGTPLPPRRERKDGRRRRKASPCPTQHIDTITPEGLE